MWLISGFMMAGRRTAVAHGENFPLVGPVGLCSRSRLDDGPYCPADVFHGERIWKASQRSRALGSSCYAVRSDLGARSDGPVAMDFIALGGTTLVAGLVGLCARGLGAPSYLC